VKSTVSRRFGGRRTPTGEAPGAAQAGGEEVPPA
jgi:hypothetical protein